MNSFIIPNDINQFYINKAQEVFNWCNGKINILNNNAILIIDNYDFVTRDYGTFVSPNVVYLYISEMIYASLKILNTIDYDAICSEIIITCIHELSHLDQKMDLFKYKDNEFYRNAVEYITEMNSFLYIKSNIDLLEKIFNFNFNSALDKVPLGIQNPSYEYRDLCTPAELYDQIFYHSINFFYSSISSILKDKSIKNIYFTICDRLEAFNYVYSVAQSSKIYENVKNKINGIPIKYKGNWVAENISHFSSLLRNKFLIYGNIDYELYITTDNIDNEISSSIILIISDKNPLINPLR